MVTLTFLGTSNAFGHSGSHTSCYLLKGSKTILLDAGYSLFSAIRSQYKLFPKIDAILISHNHPDHYMGLPQMVLEDKYVIQRDMKIPIYGPIGLEEKILQISQVIYNEEVVDHIPNIFEFFEFGPNEQFTIPGGSVSTLPASHSGNARMQIIRIDGKTIGYTGDTSFVLENFEKLLKSDIVITEVTSFKHKIPDHITYEDLTNLTIPNYKRIYLSHLGESVIEKSSEIEPPFYLSYDGLKIDL